MQFRLSVALMLIGGLAWVGIRVNHAMNYQTVTADVVSVTSECYFQDKSYYVVAEQTRTSKGHWPCTRIKDVQAGIPEFADFHIKGKVEIAFEYVSPADHQTHAGKLTFPYEDNPGYADMTRGDTVPVLAHDSDSASYARPD